MDNTRFFTNPKNLNDDELEREYQATHSREYDSVMNDDSVSPMMKEWFQEQRRDVEQEKQRREDEMLYPLNEFLGFPGI